jgi:hypothetical protein
MGDKRLVLGVGTVVAIAAVVFGVIGVVNRRGETGPKRQLAANPTGELTEFRNEQAGFAISHPKDWIRLEPSDPTVALVAAERDPAQNQGGSILVRVTPLGAPVGRDELAEARKVTDEVVKASPEVELKTEPAMIEQGGLPGLFYFYTFKDPASGQRGAHSHYFLFKGATMISVVFQALPESDFVRLAPLWDRIAEGVHGLA